MNMQSNQVCSDIEFTIPGIPQGKARPRFMSHGGRPYTPQKTRDYEELIRWSYRANIGNRRIDAPISAAITAYFAIPASWSKKKLEKSLNGEIKPSIKPDADNIAKIVLDALCRVAYHDDAAVVRLSVTKAYSENPRVEVTLISEIP